MDRITGIELYLRVVETGSFSKAAADLGVTQPTATRHVAALEAQLGARLLHRSTRGVTPTEVGQAYYERCKHIALALEEAGNLASLLQAGVGGTLRVGCSVAFGRRVLVPLTLRYMQQHPGVTLDLSFDDRYVNLVEQGIDVAVRMGRLADSTLGARYLGINPWAVLAAPALLERRGMPAEPTALVQEDCLVYSSVMGDDRWQFRLPDGGMSVVPVKGPLRSNNLSAVLAACRAGLGFAALPWYVAGPSVQAGELVPVLTGHALPSQEMHAVFPSPRLVPGKVRSFVDFLQQQFTAARWWEMPLTK
ncbi:LysR family transcriptional regulator [Aquincola tertiaricarbonis]|uniref:LysR family transcriptional regulator n=1 Tax=Aquincola tertiaricarbonis TaxID=391953 RepID=UPI000614F793|nr:LysR family transcriptional regulator [Aquincola tertiaricarbonis]